MADKCLNKLYRCDENKGSYEELKKLENHFKNAYTLKALEAQIAEKEAERVAEVAHEKFRVKLMTIENERIINGEIKKKYEIMKERELYRSVLDEQIESKYLARMVEEEMDKKERQVLIEVDKIIDEEYERMMRKKRDALGEILRRERMIFREIREIKRMMEMEMEREESMRVFDYENEVMKRSMEMKKLLDEQRRRRDAVIDSVAKLFVDNESDKIQRESLMNDLVAEEMSRQLLMEEYEIERRMRDKKIELSRDLKEQMMFSVESEKRYHELDKIFADSVMAKIMEDDRMEILTTEARKRKQIIYRKDLEKLIQERKRIRNDAVDALKDDWREMREDIQREIKEERQRLIRKHIGNVGEYLRKGVLSREEEEEFLQ